MAHRSPGTKTLFFLSFLLAASPSLASVQESSGGGPGLGAGLMFLGMVGAFVVFWIRMRN